MSRRSDRINGLLRQEISMLLSREIKDPRLTGVISITQVQTSSDLRNARVFVSVMGDDETKNAALAGIQSAATFLRRSLRDRLKLRYVPFLKFSLDESMEDADAVLRIMDGIQDGGDNSTDTENLPTYFRPIVLLQPGLTVVSTGKRTGGPPSIASINGYLNLYKPVGITSMEALRQVKRITGQRKKVGHAGTMDPLARGVLPVCFGQATRLMEYVVDGEKRYRMEVFLGATTVTFDSEGEVTPVQEPDYVTREMVENTCRRFIGTIDQKPPMYSAVKVDGQRLYKLARAGLEVDREARSVDIFDIRLVRFYPAPCHAGRGVWPGRLHAVAGPRLGPGPGLRRLRYGPGASVLRRV